MDKDQLYRRNIFWSCEKKSKDSSELLGSYVIINNSPAHHHVYENASQVRSLRSGQVPNAGVDSAIHSPTWSGIWYYGAKREQNLFSVSFPRCQCNKGFPCDICHLLMTSPSAIVSPSLHLFPHVPLWRPGRSATVRGQTAGSTTV